MKKDILKNRILLARQPRMAGRFNQEYKNRRPEAVSSQSSRMAGQNLPS